MGGLSARTRRRATVGGGANQAGRGVVVAIRTSENPVQSPVRWSMVTGGGAGESGSGGGGGGERRDIR